MRPKLLLTGASGFLGTALIPALSAYHIIGVSRTAQISKGIEWVTPEHLAGSGINFEIVVHAATAYGRNGESSEEIDNANLTFAKNTLELAIQERSKVFVNVDTSQPASTSEYANTKAQFRAILRERQAAIRIVNLELEHFYGPQAPAANFIRWIVDSFLQNIPVLGLSPCEQERDFVHIDDVVRAIDLVLKNQYRETSVGFISFEIGSGQTIKLRALIQMLREMTRNTKTLLEYGARAYNPGEPMHSVANLEKLRALGFSPEINLRDGLQQVVSFRREALKA